MSVTLRRFVIHQIVRDQLKQLFYNPTPSTQSRHKNNQVQYDGFEMVSTDQADTIQVQTLSHALNTLATFTLPSDWIDYRTPSQRRQNDKELKPIYPQSIKEAKELKAMSGNQVRRAYWSTEDFDPPGTPPQEQTTCIMHLLLTDGAMHFYAHFAKHYKMRALSFRPHGQGQATTPMERIEYTNHDGTITSGLRLLRSSNQQVASALEAIGCHMLMPPEDYMRIIAEHPNRNMARPNRMDNSMHNHKGRKLFGNRNGTSWTYDPSLLHPITREYLQELNYMDKDGNPTEYLLSMERKHPVEEEETDGD